MLDLYNIKYDKNTLKKHIYELKMIDILKTQYLDIFFIVRYIMSDLYHITNEDTNISVETVIKYQPHISKEELQKELENYNSDDDSFGDFQTFSEQF